MRKFACAAIASTFVVTAIAPNAASALPPPPPAVVATSSSTAGAWAAGGIIGVAAFLATYDLVRRTTCSGDFFVLGGPGFNEPLTVGNVMVPQCPVVHKGKRNRH